MTDDLDALLAQACGARNPDPHLGHDGLCVRRPTGHTGKHDDMFKPPWGDAWATREDNLADALRTLRADYDTALDVIARLDKAWIHENGVPVGWVNRYGPEPTYRHGDEAFWTPERMAVLAAAETRREQT